MQATQVVLLGGLKLDEQQRTLSAADRIVALALLEENGALPLGGCVLFVELVEDEAAPKEQAIRIALQGPPGTLGLMNRPVAFAAAEEGRRKATVLLNLDGVGVKTPGTYVFRVFSGTDEVGSLEVAARVAHGTARVRLGRIGEGRLCRCRPATRASRGRRGSWRLHDARSTTRPVATRAIRPPTSSSSCPPESRLSAPA